jgi:hypothetical protein
MPSETRLTQRRIDQFFSEACQACPIRAGLKTEPQRIDLI